MPNNLPPDLDDLEITLPSQWEEWLMRHQAPDAVGRPDSEQIYIGLRLECQFCDFSDNPNSKIDRCPVCDADGDLFRYAVAIRTRPRGREKTDIDRAYQMTVRAYDLLEAATAMLGDGNRALEAASVLERTDILVQLLDEVEEGEEALTKIREYEESSSVHL